MHIPKKMEGIEPVTHRLEGYNPMSYKRKYSIFISSTYEDLKEERQAVMSVAVESDFIPVGMEHFHAAPASQWDVITKMIDDCDFYLLIIGGRYGSIDDKTGKSFTEKEYDYAKSKGLKVLVLIKERSSITLDQIDDDKDGIDRGKLLKKFIDRVKNDEKTVDFFTDINSLKYRASATLKGAGEYADSTAGWIRYKDLAKIINEEAKSKYESTMAAQQQLIADIKDMLSQYASRLTEIEDSPLASGELPVVTQEDIDKWFQVKGETLVIGSSKTGELAN